MDNPWIWALFGWLILVNVISFTAFGADKKRAREKTLRVPEKTLFALALSGGGLGAFLGMHLFHHKTKHWYFRVFIPLILLVQIAAGVAIWMHLSGRF